MNPCAADHPQAGLYAVYTAAAISVCGVAAGLHLMVPDEVADYVSNGLMHPVFRYGLLFSLIACGVALSGGRRPLALAAHLAILASATWFGLHWGEPVVLLHQTLTELIVRYPVLAAAMSVTAGSALLLPLSARKWLLPFVSAICGLGLSLSVILDSPVDFYADWFSSAGGTGGLAVVLASIILTDSVRRICAGSWLTIAERILGSWLIAASLMLAALAFLPERPPDTEPFPSLIPDEIDPS